MQEFGKKEGERKIGRGNRWKRRRRGGGGENIVKGRRLKKVREARQKKK